MQAQLEPTRAEASSTHCGASRRPWLLVILMVLSFIGYGLGHVHGRLGHFVYERLHQLFEGAVR